MRARMRQFARLLAPALLCAAIPAAAQETGEMLEDGVYLISRAGTRRVEVSPVFDNERLLIHDYRFLDAGMARSTPQQLVVVGTTPDVPLVLADEPSAETDEEGRSLLRLLLAAEERVKLEKLTTARGGRGVAIVVGGEIVTARRITAPIADGRLEIAGCRAGAAEHLVRRLRDNVVPKPDEGQAGD
jgi:hypothetical protein